MYLELVGCSAVTGLTRGVDFRLQYGAPSIVALGLVLSNPSLFLAPTDP